MKRLIKSLKKTAKDYYDLHWRNCLLFKNRVSIAEVCKVDVTVSLTTTSFRIDGVAKVIRTILNQTYMPIRVVLWVSSEPYLKDKGIAADAVPRELRIMAVRDKRFEIRWTKNIGSYRKLIPALKEFTGVIVTADDDTLYPVTWLEGLFKLHEKYPAAVCCYRATKIEKTENGGVLPYLTWKEYQDESPSFNCFPTGKDGILYPSGALHGQVLNEGAFMRMAPSADDIWFKAMSVLNNTPSCKLIKLPDLPGVDNTTHRDFDCIDNTDENGLLSINKSANDSQMKAVFEAYNINL